MTEAPIFILGLQRGGTNQILNVLRSHPDTCWPDGELHEAVRPMAARREGVAAFLRKTARYLPILLAAGDLFSPHRSPPPGALSGWKGAWLASTLADATRRNMGRVAAHKAPLAERGLIRPSTGGPNRMMVKLVNHNVGFLRDLLALYPAARFVGIIRDPVATCEGRMSRGGTFEEATAVFNYVGAQFAGALDEGLPLRVLRFEDLVADAAATMRAALDAAGLDQAAIDGVRLQDKRRKIDKAGRIVGLDKVDAYYAFADVGRHMRADANAGSASRLDPARIEAIRRVCAPAMARFGYG